MELELGTTPSEEPESITWFGGARGHWTEYEDFIRAAAWEFRGYIREYGDLKAVLAVQGTHYYQGKRKRYRPTHWSLEFQCGRLTQQIAAGRCSSIIAAQKIATPLVQSSLSGFAAWAYRECEKISVYRYAPQRPTRMNLVKVEEPSRYAPRMSGWHDPLTRELMKSPRNWEPWFTYFEIDWDPHKVFPYGHYLFVRTEQDGKMHAAIHDCGSWSWSSVADPAITRLAARMPAWCES